LKPTKRLKTTILVDGDSVLKRAFAGAKHVYYRGQHIGGLYQFYTILRRCLIDFKPNKVVVFWDGQFSGSERKKIYPNYKANRVKEFNEDYERQKLRVKTYAEDLFIRQYQDNYSEADDGIAYYTHLNKDKEKIIVMSSDYDMCQLLDENVNIFLHNKKKVLTIYNYTEMFDHHHSNAVTMKLISGCSSDNVSGIALVKEKTLMKFFPDLKDREMSVEEILAQAQILREERGKPLKSLDNIINGTTKDGTLGLEFYKRNEDLVTLDGRLLSEESKEDISDISDLPIDPEGRTKKNVLKMMMEDGFIEMIPGNEDGYINYLKPYMNLIKNEKKVAL
tara:strand:+ start:2626 stop:3630 length:1005 start_codon:yes stop_codon:yes gene_type:complete